LWQKSLRINRISLCFLIIGCCILCLARLGVIARPFATDDSRHEQYVFDGRCAWRGAILEQCGNSSRAFCRIYGFAGQFCLSARICSNCSTTAGDGHLRFVGHADTRV
jgi:hypothetical protein